MRCSMSLRLAISMWLALGMPSLTDLPMGRLPIVMGRSLVASGLMPRGVTRKPFSGGLAHGPMMFPFASSLSSSRCVDSGFRSAEGPFGASTSSVRSPTNLRGKPWIAQRTRSSAPNIESSSFHWEAAASVMGSGPLVSHLAMFLTSQPAWGLTCRWGESACSSRRPATIGPIWRVSMPPPIALRRSMFDIMTSSPSTEPTAV